MANDRPLSNDEIAHWAATIETHAPGWIHADGSSVEVKRAEAIAFSLRIVATLAEKDARFSRLVKAAKEYMRHSASTVGVDESLRQALMDALEDKS